MSKVSPKVEAQSLFTDFDIGLFKAGKHYRLYEKLGSHLIEKDGRKGVYFAVWAPGATSVSVMGNFNGRDKNQHKLFVRWDSSGIWEGFIPGLKAGEVYKYSIIASDGRMLEKTDPYARTFEIPPKTASIVSAPAHKWKDVSWMKDRASSDLLKRPVSVYEVHIGSWKRRPDEGNRSLTYLELIDDLVPYVKEMGYTHVEFLPVMEHPFFGSWGYQVVGYYAPSSRYGSSEDFMALIDAFHQNGIGVILDWVPSHFPNDEHGLYRFDGNALFEHADPRQGYHPDWKSSIFNYGRNEVRAFLISNANYWFDQFHVDALRVDAVASMLYLDYSRKEGEWIPNQFGGRENLEAIAFLKELNEEVYRSFPGIQMIAEESTSWPMVSRPVFLGGLGFGMKWMMGWMNDVLEYFKKDPMYRKYHQNQITFSLAYTFTENFMLPLSHDEVVHGKGSLLQRMPGDEWQRFANLRLLYGWQYVHPGTKLLFMGGEFGQSSEWHHDESLPWHLTQYPVHVGVQRWIQALNNLYKTHTALFAHQFEIEGFSWIDFADSENSVLALERIGDKGEKVIAVLNLTPVVREGYALGSAGKSAWKEILNSDDPEFGGSGVSNPKPLKPVKTPLHGKPFRVELTLPPLAVVIFETQS